MNTDQIGTKPRLSSPWLFFAVTFGWSWLFWILAARSGLGLSSPGGGGLLMLGILGPMLAGIGFTYLTRDREGRRDYWRRIVDFRRIHSSWYMAIFLFVPILIAMAVLLDVLLGGRGGTWGEVIVGFRSAPWAIIPSALFASLFPFIEELGWRGYVLDRLQERWSALASGLILGVLWSLWHLPLFFIPDTYQYGLGVGTPAFWLFTVGVIPLTIVFSWIFINTSRSTLAVILFHAMVNFTGELFAVSERADALSILLWVLAAIGVVVLWGAGTLTGRPQHAPATARPRPAL
jgi:membrane protease YdiL (CAAX protease family)